MKIKSKQRQNFFFFLMSRDQWRQTRKSDELFPGVNLWGAPQLAEAQLSSLLL